MAHTCVDDPDLNAKYTINFSFVDRWPPSFTANWDFDAVCLAYGPGKRYDYNREEFRCCIPESLVNEIYFPRTKLQVAGYSWGTNNKIERPLDDDTPLYYMLPPIDPYGDEYFTENYYYEGMLDRRDLAVWGGNSRSMPFNERKALEEMFPGRMGTPWLRWLLLLGSGVFTASSYAYDRETLGVGKKRQNETAKEGMELTRRDSLKVSLATILSGLTTTGVGASIVGHYVNKPEIEGIAGMIYELDSTKGQIPPNHPLIQNVRNSRTLKTLYPVTYLQAAICAEQLEEFVARQRKQELNRKPHIYIPDCPPRYASLVYFLRNPAERRETIKRWVK